ncbi:MAG TPA: OmpA family protein [Flavobacteriaceae bacterium]|nr:OmpA family protein [Flavobacteriaceae bacterium]MCB9213117.1 OmpA family protein [Alteromonas sp.]HPF11023.1 OmpA family protein [Flavobacteriaceae bacterium]HQU21878.1 OmpA family protein [Flavobacteriaceae bacterium]HQU64128.1 OmpA family protein [Flavobacteriaceae bacterium]
MQKVWLAFFLLCSVGMVSQETEAKFSLYYENDQFELTPVHQHILDSLKRLENKSLYDIHINGYTNSIGESDYNLELSRKRAAQVKKELRSFTIISSTGYGELETEAANNRRVDILIHFKKDHIPEAGEIVEAPIDEFENQPTVASLVTPKIGDKVILQGIMFYPDRDVIMDESKNALEELVAFLKKHPKIKFKLLGHICCGDDERPHIDLINVRTGKKDLSEARAKSLYNYLQKNGIEKHRMRYVGMAYRNPTGKGDEYDRRVEIEITSVE